MNKLWILGMFLLSGCVSSSQSWKRVKIGYERGLEEGYVKGVKQGYAQGYGTGKNEGYLAGKRDCPNIDNFVFPAGKEVK